MGFILLLKPHAKILTSHAAEPGGEASGVTTDISRQKQCEPVVSALFVLEESGNRPPLLVCQLSPQTIEALSFKSVFQVEQVYIVIMVHRVPDIGRIVGAQKFQIRRDRYTICLVI